MSFSIVVDGHNFINDLDRYGKDKDYILSTLSFPFLHAAIQERLKNQGLYSHPFIHTEFVCSNGGRIGPFEHAENDLLKKLRNEKGVTVLEVPQETRNQKGVDFTVFIRMMTLAQSTPQPHEVVLFASDTDYVPAIRLLSEQGTHVVIVGFRTGTPPLNEGLINESYWSIDLGDLLKEMEKASDTHGMHPITEQRAPR